MTTAVTKESLIARIADLEYGARSLKEDYTLAAYKMLLATTGVAPVAYTNRGALADVYCGLTSMMGPADTIGDIALYTRAQQPVVPDELLKEYLRLVECMLSDYRDSNYGDAQRWIRHIAEASDAFEEKHGLSPWEMARKTFRAAMLNQK